MTTDNQPAPERIWADCRDLRADRFLVVRGSTKQFDSDVEYIRADLARSPVAGDATCEWTNRSRTCFDQTGGEYPTEKYCPFCGKPLKVSEIK